MKTKKPKKRIAYIQARISPELWHKAKIKAVKNGISFQKLIEQAVQEWVSRE